MNAAVSCFTLSPISIISISTVVEAQLLHVVVGEEDVDGWNDGGEEGNDDGKEDVDGWNDGGEEGDDDGKEDVNGWSDGMGKFRARTLVKR